MSAVLDRLYKVDEVIALLSGEVAEQLNALACVALSASVPHDSLKGVTCAAVVQTIFGTSTELAQATSPERSGTAPTRTDVIDHEQAVLHKVGIRPNGLMRVTRHVVIGKHQVRILYVIVARGP